MKRFTEEIAQILRDKLPDTQIEIREISKPGERRLTGLCIRSDMAPVAPVLYLDEPYRSYQQESSIQDIADKLLEIYHLNTLTTPFDPSVITDWGEASQRVCARLINVPHNTDYLKDKVFEPIVGTDIAFMYYIDLDSIHDGVSTPVTRNLLLSWGITPSTLHDIAFLNTRRLHPPKIQPMACMMQEMMGTDGPVIEDGPSMYVITSDRMLHGAVLSLMPDVFETLEESLGDFYLLPSSVHEMIAVPQSLQSPDVLLSMVTDINHTQVEQKDRLADDVYVIKHGNLISAFADDPASKQQAQMKALS